jgi:hypothetical protein
VSSFFFYPTYMHCNYRPNNRVESTACMYRAGPLKHYRKEVVPQEIVENTPTAQSSGAEQRNALNRVRSKNIMSSDYFPSADQHLQHQNHLFSQQQSASGSCSSCEPTIKHTNQQFYQDGATSSSALVARIVHNRKIKNAPGPGPYIARKGDNIY